MKKNTLSAILMTLFLFISCNNSGKDGNASTNPADESKGPNLTEISKKITNSNAVVLAVKEVETLLSSIDELAKKAIGKKIDQNNTLVALNGQNGSLLAGAYAISTLITEKLSAINDSGELKAEIEKAKECSKKFTEKLANNHTDLGKQDVSDAHAQEAILKTNGANGKGAKELKELSELVANLTKAAKETLTNSVKELTSPVVAGNPKKPN
ncbi:Vsp/OspC family lipoprotein [Borreliella bissettiae]|uniref:Vsp/OspC family lipoprotein n=1 Tax=Borrelia bissettiae TaxID=64897 RepID=UPI0026482494|nr:Vsp/OspC family lipoprotein [Borreliella bissettiae]WKD00263.1 Vsp/OspC family lipoprotein [Borreliella bissettiae]WMB90952.1 outer surface protein C [Borreliella bissettiae]